MVSEKVSEKVSEMSGMSGKVSGMSNQGSDDSQHSSAANLALASTVDISKIAPAF